MKKKRDKKENKVLIIVIIVILLAIAILLFSGVGDNLISNGESDSTPKISPTELVDNKEKYEGKDVWIMNVLVPDPLFAYVKKGDGNDERLFIEPKKSEYCLYFNLKGKLEKDPNEKRDWIFFIEKFECVSTT